MSIEKFLLNPNEKDLKTELISFVNSVANNDNWVGERNNEWFAKRHCWLWAKEIQAKIKLIDFGENNEK